MTDEVKNVSYLDTPVPRVFDIEGEKPTLSIPAEALEAIRAWEETKTEEIAQVLAPFGLHPYEMPPTEWRRYLTHRDIRRISEQIVSLLGDVEGQR